MIATLEFNPDCLFISRVPGSIAYQSLWEKSLLLKLPSAFLCSLWQNSCLHHHLPANTGFPHSHAGSQGFFSSPWAHIALVQDSELPGLLNAKHHLPRQQNQRDNTTEHHSVSLCGVIVPAITPPLLNDTKHGLQLRTGSPITHRLHLYMCVIYI